MLEIPVFVVEPEVDDRAPLLVDGAHQAVSMPDMIIATQSHDARYASSFACDGAATRVNLRDPTKAAVLALAEHLGGALPTHLGADRSRSDRGVIGVEEEWLWSVGSHPLSSTCAFLRSSRTDADAPLMISPVPAWVKRSVSRTSYRSNVEREARVKSDDGKSP